MKATILFALSLSFGAYAQIPHPADLLADAEPATLKFLGKKLLKNSISVKSCVFENDRVAVIYGNCIQRKEAPATSLYILSKAGGRLNVYIENSDAMEKSGSISTQPRSNYDRAFRVSYAPSAPFENFSVDEIDALAKTYLNDFCDTSVDPQPLPGSPEFGRPTTVCYGGLKSQRDEWNQTGFAFWQEPGESWYRFLREMRVLSSKIP